MKVCCVCRQEKNLCEFHKNKNNKDGYQNQCKLCKKEIDKKWNKDNREKRNNYNKKFRDKTLNWITEYKLNKKCEICGYDRCPKALEFHHTEDDKSFILSEYRIHGYCIKKIEEEAKKCIVVCANCHREIHCNIIKI